MEPIVHFNPIQSISAHVYMLENLRLDAQPREDSLALTKRVQETLRCCPNEVKNPALILDCLRLAERVRRDALGTPTYVKKDDTFLKRTMILGSTATYILLKSKDDLPKMRGGFKVGAFALRIPVNPNEKPTSVYQLVNNDERGLLEEDELNTQKYFASLGISPQIYDTFDYTKEKTGTKKRCAFVETFDGDLYLFNNTSKERPFPLKPQQLFDTAYTLAKHISTLHSLSCAHGDFQLENIGVRYDAVTERIIQLFLTDLGTVIKLGQPNAMQQGALSLYYEPPESFEGEVTDQMQREIYKIGIALSMLVDGDPTEYEPVWLDALAEMNTEKPFQECPEEEPYTFTGNLSWLNNISKRTGQNITPDQIANVISEQRAYREIAETALEELDEQDDPLEFYLRLFSIMLHPEPTRRPTAAQIVAYCDIFKAKYLDTK